LTPVDYTSRLGTDKRERGKVIGLLLDWQSHLPESDTPSHEQPDEAQGMKPAGM